MQQNTTKRYYLHYVWKWNRSGEILGLQWKDIDFNKNIIDINKSVRDGRIKSTKNEYSERKIQITKECKIGFRDFKRVKK